MKLKMMKKILKIVQYQKILIVKIYKIILIKMNLKKKKKKIKMKKKLLKMIQYLKASTLIS
jgi:hypothetical protein